MLVIVVAPLVVIHNEAIALFIPRAHQEKKEEEGDGEETAGEHEYHCFRGDEEAPEVYFLMLPDNGAEPFRFTSACLVGV